MQVPESRAAPTCLREESQLVITERDGIFDKVPVKRLTCLAQAENERFDLVSVAQEGQSRHQAARRR